MARNIVIGQKIRSQIHKAAKELRSHQTLQESILWEYLRANRLDGLHFRRQQVIAGFVVDFYCHQAGLVIVLDGPVHDEPDQRTHDQERDQVISLRGLQILRIQDSDVDHCLEDVLNRIRNACSLPSLPVSGREGQGMREVP